MGDANPVLAALDAVRRHRYHAVVVSTWPVGRSRWLRRDVVGRLRRQVPLPVVHPRTADRVAA